MDFEDLRVGQTASLGKTITEADILLFASVIVLPRLAVWPTRRSSKSIASLLSGADH